MAKLSILPFQNTYISEWYKDSNFGDSTALFVGQYVKKGDNYRSLLQFDLGIIPHNSTIEKAVLELSMYRNESKGIPIEINVYRVLNQWNHFSITWKNQPLAYTESEGNVTIDSNISHNRILIDITELVKGWYNGSIPNNGLILKGNESTNNLAAFRNIAFKDSSTWPILHINYVSGIMNCIDKEELVIPETPPYLPIEASTPIPLGPKNKATFLIKNDTESHHVMAMLQVGYSSDPQETFFDSGSWVHLKPKDYPGEAVALTTTDVAEFARVLVKGKGGEIVYVWTRTYEF